jgi:hypothetical protein
MRRGLSDRHWRVPRRAPGRWPRRRRPPQGLRRLSRSAPLLGSCSCSPGRAGWGGDRRRSKRRTAPGAAPSHSLWGRSGREGESARGGDRRVDPAAREGRHPFISGWSNGANACGGRGRTASFLARSDPGPGSVSLPADRVCLPGDD